MNDKSETPKLAQFIYYHGNFTSQTGFIFGDRLLLDNITCYAVFYCKLQLWHIVLNVIFGESAPVSIDLHVD